MNSTYSELLKQRSELDQKIEQARAQELNAAIQQIRELMNQYGITAQEIMSAGAKLHLRRERAKVEPKYRDPATGATWSGRGKPPAWIAGKDRALFVIDPKP
jgi:DNA-binding protein H-NS